MWKEKSKAIRCRGEKTILEVRGGFSGSEEARGQIEWKDDITCGEEKRLGRRERAKRGRGNERGIGESDENRGAEDVASGRSRIQSLTRDCLSTL
jgi:hypothetical protein